MPNMPEWVLPNVLRGLKMLAPLLAAYLIYQAVKVIYTYVMSQWV